METKELRSRSLLRNALWTALGRGSGLLTGFLLSPFLLAGLGKEQFGLWILVFVLGHHFGLVLNFGTGYALISLCSQRQDDKPGLARAIGLYLLASSGLGLLILGAMALTGPWLIEYFALGAGSGPTSDADFAWQLLMLSGLTAAFRPLAYYFESVLQGLERFAEAGALAFLRALLWVGAALLVLRWGYGPRALFVAELLTLALLMVFGTAVLWRVLGQFKIVAWPSAEDRREFVGFGLGVTPTILADMFNTQSDKLALGLAIDLDAARLRQRVTSFEMGQKLTGPGRQALEMVAQVLFPAVPGLIKDRGLDGLKRLHRFAQKFVTLLSGLFFLSLCALADPILRAWLGPARVDPLMVWSLRALSLVMLLALLNAVAVQLARGLSKLQVEMKSALIFSALGLLLRLVLLFGFGFYGLLVGALITAMGLYIFQLRAFAAVLHYQPWAFVADSTLKPLLIAALAALSVWGLDTLLPELSLTAMSIERGPWLLRLAVEGVFLGLVSVILVSLTQSQDEDWQLLMTRLRELLRRTGDERAS